MSLPPTAGQQVCTTAGELSRALQGAAPRWWGATVQPKSATVDRPAFCVYEGQLVLVMDPALVSFVQEHPTNPPSMGQINLSDLAPEGATLEYEWAGIAQLLAGVAANTPDGPLRVWCPVNQTPVSMCAELSDGLLRFYIPAEVIDAIVAAA